MPSQIFSYQRKHIFNRLKLCLCYFPFATNSLLKYATTSLCRLKSILSKARTARIA